MSVFETGNVLAVPYTPFPVSAGQRSSDTGMPIPGLPVFGTLMALIVIMLFNSLKKTVIVFILVPLSVIGVVAGLLLLDVPFSNYLPGRMIEAPRIQRTRPILLDAEVAKYFFHSVHMYAATIQAIEKSLKKLDEEFKRNEIRRLLRGKDIPKPQLM